MSVSAMSSYRMPCLDNTVSPKRVRASNSPAEMAQQRRCVSRPGPRRLGRRHLAQQRLLHSRCPSSRAPSRGQPKQARRLQRNAKHAGRERVKMESRASVCCTGMTACTDNLHSHSFWHFKTVRVECSAIVAELNRSQRQSSKKESALKGSFLLLDDWTRAMSTHKHRHSTAAQTCRALRPSLKPIIGAILINPLAKA
jgi:hypothetical protein